MLINLFLKDVSLVPITEEQKLLTGSMHTEELGFITYGELVHGLKKLVFQCINHNDDVYAYEQNGNRVLEFLKEFYTEYTMYLPPEYRAEELMEQYSDLSDNNKDLFQQRLICDYIAGMMESYAITIYEKYSSRKFQY